MRRDLCGLLRLYLDVFRVYFLLWCWCATFFIFFYLACMTLTCLFLMTKLNMKYFTFFTGSPNIHFVYFLLHRTLYDDYITF